MDARSNFENNGYKTNICFDCQRAVGKCSWSEINPETGKPRFLPVPGSVTEKSFIKDWHTKRKTLRIVSCPLFLPD